MEHPFDALATPAKRAQASAAWRQWIEALPAHGLPADLLAMLASGDPHQVERAARAAGALGADDAAVAHIARAIDPWLRIADRISHGHAPNTGSLVGVCDSQRLFWWEGLRHGHESHGHLYKLV